MIEETTQKAETPEDFGETPSGVAKRWITAIKQAERHRKDWVKRVEKIIEIYRDQRPESDNTTSFNILWSNVQTLLPTLYSQTPKPQVSRRFKDKDEVGRQAAEILERAAEYSVDEYDFDELMESAVEDHCLGGLGAARVTYEPLYGEKKKTDDGKEYEPVVYEKAPCKYVHWKDFVHGPGRTWNEVNWLAYKSYLTRNELVERFGEIGKKVKLDYKPEGLEEDASPEEFHKAVIYEIWDKDRKQVLWISLHMDNPLEVGPPPLKLSGFFPSPKPLLATTTTDTLTPVPDYAEYQDQAEELNSLTDRIDSLLNSLKLAGFYAGDEKSSIKKLEGAQDGELIPIDSWAAFAEKGGVRGLIEWMPVEAVGNVLIGLYEARERVKQDLYEITGMADIIRGSSDSGETATAQRIKGQFASLRLKKRQARVAKFARDLIRLKVEVIAEEFSPQTLQIMTGQQVTQEVVKLLRNDPVRNFRIDIETDSTLQVDEQADKEARVEFLSAVSAYLEKSVVATREIPGIAPLLGEMLLFGVRGFRVGRELEGSIEDALEQISNAPPQENPEASAAAQESAMKMQESQAKMQESQAKLQLEARKLEADQQMKAQEMALKTRELEIKQQELALRAQEIGIKADGDAKRFELDRVSKIGEMGAIETPEGIMPISVIAEMMENINQQTQASLEIANSARESSQINLAAVQGMGDAINQMVNAITAPKVLIRDECGKAIGVETVQ